jgi:hypothetical protein
MWVKSLGNSNPQRSARLNIVVLPDHPIAEVNYVAGRRNSDEDDFFWN